jgi:hypothetical protein
VLRSFVPGLCWRELTTRHPPRIGSNLAMLVASLFTIVAPICAIALLSAWASPGRAAFDIVQVEPIVISLIWFGVPPFVLALVSRALSICIRRTERSFAHLLRLTAFFAPTIASLVVVTTTVPWVVMQPSIGGSLATMANVTGVVLLILHLIIGPVWTWLWWSRSIGTYFDEVRARPVALAGELVGLGIATSGVTLFIVLWN